MECALGVLAVNNETSVTPQGEKHSSHYRLDTVPLQVLYVEPRLIEKSGMIAQRTFQKVPGAKMKRSPPSESTIIGREALGDESRRLP